MKAGKRREELLEKLKKSPQPIIGSELADEFEVSRQVIVQDIALLRARGEEIIATSQGYIIPGSSVPGTITTTIACQHGYDQVEDELMTIVSYGGKIVDVIVEHPIYGELRGLLMIQSGSDVKEFMSKLEQEETTLLSSLTEGVHLHTIEVMNQEVINRLKAALEGKGYLLNE